MKKILFAVLAIVICVTACVKDPIYDGITITNIKHSPETITDNDEVFVTADITSFVDFTAKLYYTVNEGQENIVEMNRSNSSNDKEYIAAIPEQALNAKIVYWIVANSDEKTVESTKLDYEVGALVIDYTKLRLNELNGNDKFIELYNGGTIAIPMTGVYIQKDGLENWRADETIIVNAGEYLLLYSVDVKADYPEHPENLFFNSGLSAKKEVRVQLFTPGGVSIDDFNLTTLVITAPNSYSRNADGVWYHAVATPGAQNVDGTEIVEGLEGGVIPTPDYTNLVLNELNGGFKFIELYNKGNVELSLKDMYMEKDGSTLIWTSEDIVIPANGYLLLYSEDVASTHPTHPANQIFGSGLSAKKSVKIELFMPDGTSRDVFTRGPEPWNVTNLSDLGSKSMARTPDGGDWKLVEEATPGTANPATGDEIPQE
ncbi:MAG: lamin tail domain-containing protein [Bacteroidales bacterium]|jgi:hypothetical protein|nr:lamin tail domain-containing protein [Bacteroidales bacterium]